MKQTLILGNIITMDEKKPFAKGLSCSQELPAWSKLLGL